MLRFLQLDTSSILIIRGILALLAGVFLIAFGNLSISTLGILFGVYLVFEAFGVAASIPLRDSSILVKIIQGAYAILLLFGAGYLFLNPFETIVSLVVLIGILVIIQNTVNVITYIHSSRSVIPYLFGIVIGCIALFAPTITLLAARWFGAFIFFIIGIILISTGLLIRSLKARIQSIVEENAGIQDTLQHTTRGRTIDVEIEE